MSGKIDLNPMNSALATGAGLPWGAMNSGDPGDMPAIPKERNINDFSAFDQSEMVKRLISGLRGNGQKEAQGALRMASRMGAVQSDAARRNQNEIAAGVEDRSRGIELQAAKDAWDSKLGQKQFAENSDLQKYQLAAQQWQAKKSAYAQEQAERNSGLKKIARGITTLGTSYIADQN